ncbi:hypothetical protein QR680_000195 [Steinernema hermaphroditum]|uniref:Uncharacterized protein n=1 Tax=Steinernema hermaphroditum TaxID=289476 RepID=A0AA39GTR1_9BILA|nr:hypothetical protein QR680_000195 [Steinernema hermaphroditum]
MTPETGIAEHLPYLAVKKAPHQRHQPAQVSFPSTYDNYTPRLSPTDKTPFAHRLPRRQFRQRSHKFTGAVTKLVDLIRT